MENEYAGSYKGRTEPGLGSSLILPQLSNTNQLIKACFLIHKTAIGLTERCEASAESELVEISGMVLLEASPTALPNLPRVTAVHSV